MSQLQKQYVQVVLYANMFQKWYVVTHVSTCRLCNPPELTAEDPGPRDIVFLDQTSVFMSMYLYIYEAYNQPGVSVYKTAAGMSP